jgi:hypothetical protein
MAGTAAAPGPPRRVRSQEEIAEAHARKAQQRLQRLEDVEARMGQEATSELTAYVAILHAQLAIYEAVRPALELVVHPFHPVAPGPAHPMQAPGAT